MGLRARLGAACSATGLISGSGRGITFWSSSVEQGFSDENVTE
jgi:hypothetical protein